MAETISMSFPANTEYISAIRLAVSGIAGVNGFLLDEIEDLKSCVSEACLLILDGQTGSCVQICLEVGDEAIDVRVAGEDIVAEEADGFVEFNDEISRIMIDALCDNAVFEEENGLLNSISFTKRRTS